MGEIVPYVENGSLKARCLKCDRNVQMKMINRDTVELFCNECGGQSFLIQKAE